MRLLCPFCQKPISVPDSEAGKRVACPECQEHFIAPLLATLFEQRPLPYAFALACLLLASSQYAGVYGRPLARARTFFGVHRVCRNGELLQLVHGNTIHGIQSVDAFSVPPRPPAKP